MKNKEFSVFSVGAESSGCWSLCTSVRVMAESQNPTEKPEPFN